MGKIIVNSISDINQIVDVIHDQWFDINKIKYTNQTLSIKFKKERNDKVEVLSNFLLWKRVKIPIEEYCLNISKVKDYKIKDSEKVELYDFNTIEFFENENKLKIKTGIPLSFEVFISNVEMAVEGTGTILDWKTKIKFL